MFADFGTVVDALADLMQHVGHLELDGDTFKYLFGQDFVDVSEAEIVWLFDRLALQVRTLLLLNPSNC